MSAGGEPLWAETQTVSPDAAGRYDVYLGAGNTSGLPADLFGTGEARWLEVQVAGEQPQPRVLLVSVPYALKAADAATLGGLPASAFVLAGSQVATLATAGAAAVSPDSSSTVTTPGGTKNYIPIFTGSNTIASSEIYDTGTSVGIGDIPNAGAKLDVNGTMIMRGNMTVSRTGNATSSKGYPSYGFDFYSNVYNSSTKGTDNPHFQLQSEPVGNNSSNTGATFNFLYSNHGSTPAETGLSINSSGVINFASGQTFNSTSSNVTAIFGTGTSSDGVDGVSSSGVGMRGYSSTGFGVSGTSNNSNGVNGLIPGNTINTAGVHGVAGVASGVGGGIAGVWGDAYTHVGVLGSSYEYSGVQGLSQTGPGVQGQSATGAGGAFTSSGVLATVSAANSGNGQGLYAQSIATNGEAIYADAEGVGGIGVYGISDGGTDTSDNPSTGVEGYGINYGVYGTSVAGTGAYGVTAGASNTGSFYTEHGDGAGVWGDTASDGDALGETALGAILGTADNSFGGLFINNSAGFSTLGLINDGDGPTGANIAGVLQATGAHGMCGIGSSGDLSCTGQVKTLSTTSSARMVETYAMQSPENWMEDFGSGSLSGGVATVSIDPAFAETANTGADYHVFLTARGDSDGLYVTNLTATSFEVHESKHGTSSLAFDYRIVAKRRGYEAQRLTDVTERFRTETAITTRLQAMRKDARRSGKVRQLTPRIPQIPATQLQLQQSRHPGAPVAVMPTKHPSGN